MRFSILLAIIPLAIATPLTARYEGNEQEALNECNAWRAHCFMSKYTDPEFTACVKKWQDCMNGASYDTPY
ncbi:hypothetical protein TGAMA5MH_10824 [Trichoderma gamsii]|uniref:Uncharacterized protein n=1 Tax=Trichoderma gamsii TaxID=398673 RepID=A0A2K0SVF2_9HYPO|nr:hypothetical protein TGAMA5MH_10824 [Trichoderma gamsii]